MKILSFDVGIKNLAYCLVEVKGNMRTIHSWDVINLSKEKPFYICYEEGCSFQGSYLFKSNHYCKRHANKLDKPYEKDIIPLKKISRTSIALLREKCESYHLVQEERKYVKKDYIELLKTYIQEECIYTDTKKKAKEISLIDLARTMTAEFDIRFQEGVDILLIENQIAPLANRMKTIQGMITQYFIMKNVPTIEYVSSLNKLKVFDLEKDTYANRKKASIEVVQSLVEKEFKTWKSFFIKHKKKDDLSDALLQLLWYLNK